jgi:hypothetical protein
MSIVLLLLTLLSFTAHTECQVYKSDKTKVEPQHDPFFQLLAGLNHCPDTIESLRDKMIEHGFVVRPAMVANRGRNNPTLGSFSFFEMVTGNNVMPGDWFFGHFTDMHYGLVSLDQSLAHGKLLIELLVWDSQKQIFNFYEWRGDNGRAIWFYRGDSIDILADNAYLYRNVPPGEKKFGDRMRCSACHISGGPIMKELASPYNDWWSSSRILPLSPNMPDNDVTVLMSQLIGAEEFASAVKSGIDKLEQSLIYRRVKSELSLQERLRPLFCETEINLLSDSSVTEQSVEYIEIPGEFFVSKFFSSRSFKMPMMDYLNLLDQFLMNFPETHLADADHTWLTPVKGYSDYRAIEILINEGLIDEYFAAAVLYIDVGNPNLSEQRCDLLNYVPKQVSSKWQEEFIDNLYNSDNGSAHALAENLIDHHSRSYYTQKVATYLNGIENQLKTVFGRTTHFQRLIDLRKKVYQSEISQNPRGQIFEPGFRLIFPEPKRSLTFLCPR